MPKRRKPSRRAFGSVTERQHGEETRYYVRFGWDGNRIHRAVGASRLEAQRILASAESLYRSGETWERAMYALFGDQEGAGVTFMAAVPRYLRHAERRKKPSTLRADKTRLQTISEEPWAKKDVAAITTADLQSWIDRLASEGRKAATLNRYLSAASAVLKWAKDQGLRRDNPARAVPAFSEAGNKRELYVTQTEANALIKAAREDFKPYVRAGLETGCRAGELRELRWRDVDLRTRTITVRAGYAKTGKTRGIPLTVPMVKMLKTMKRVQPSLDGSDHVFTSAAGKPLSDTMRRKRWAETKAQAKGLRSEVKEGLHYHDLRHSCASFLLGAGVSLSIVGKILGHAKPTTTERYAHLAPEVARAAMAQLDRSRGMGS